MRTRRIRESDAEGFLRLCERLDGETEFMMVEPGERTTTVDQQREIIGRAIAAGNRTILVAEDGDELAGYVAVGGGGFRRDGHCAHTVVGVLEAHSGRGIGTALLTEAERWARRHGIHRLELTVMTHNSRALALYERAGFSVEGTKRDSLLVGGSYVDEYYMAKLLA